MRWGLVWTFDKTVVFAVSDGELCTLMFQMLAASYRQVCFECFTGRAKINVLKKVARKRFIFGPSSINHFPCKINFILDLSLKNWAH